MNDEERRLITGYVERIAGAQQPQGAWSGGGQQPQQALPPVDPEADRLLWELFNRYPEARYRITQTAFVQEAALIEAQNRLRQMEWEVENARRQGQAMASQASAPRGAFGGLFGGGGRPAVPAPAPMPPPPQPQYPVGYNPQAMQQAQGRSGMGFLGTAAAAAAGVAGGMMLGNMLSGAFGGGNAHASPFGGMGGSGFGGGAGTIPTSASWDAGAKKDGGSPWDGGDKAGGSSSWGEDGGSQSSSWGQPDQGGQASSSWGQPDQGSSSWGQPDATPEGSGYASDHRDDSGGSSYDSGGSSDWGGGGSDDA